MSKEDLIELGVRNVSQRGGSLQVTLPTMVTKIMKLKPGDKIVFYYDRKVNKIFIGKIAKEKIEQIIDLRFKL